jgi:hypothetical protein
MARIRARAKVFAVLADDPNMPMDWQKVADPKGRDTALNAKCTAPRNKHCLSTLKPARQLFTDPSSPFNSFKTPGFLRRPDQSEVNRGNPNQSEVVFFFWFYGSGRGLLHYLLRVVTSDRTSCSPIFSNSSSMLNSHPASVSMNLGWTVSSEPIRDNPRCNTENPRRNRNNPSLHSGVGSPYSRHSKNDTSPTSPTVECPVHGRVCRTFAVNCTYLQKVALSCTSPASIAPDFFRGVHLQFRQSDNCNSTATFAGRSSNCNFSQDGKMHIGQRLTSLYG